MADRAEEKAKKDVAYQDFKKTHARERAMRIEAKINDLEKLDRVESENSRKRAALGSVVSGRVDSSRAPASSELEEWDDAFKSLEKR